MTAAFLLADKPSGWTSHDVVARVRTLARIRKVGHAGTLDPMATGLLVLGVGRATRLLRFVQHLPKEYIARAVFGVATDSLDADGAVLTRSPLPVTAADLDAVLPRFRGEIVQVPPMVSARKVEGRRLYRLAREGVEVEREARPVTIHELDVVDFAPSDYPEVVLRVRCSTGTYIRTLADDIARALGGRAHLSALRRLRIGSLTVERAIGLDRLADLSAAGRLEEALTTPAEALCDLPAVTVGPELEKGIRNGLAMAAIPPDADPPPGPVRILSEEGVLVAVYRRHGAALRPEAVLG